MDIDINNKPVQAHEQTGARNQTNERRPMSEREFARIVAACSVARYLTRVLSVPPATAKMVALQAIEFAEHTAIDEL